MNKRQFFLAVAGLLTMVSAFAQGPATTNAVRRMTPEMRERIRLAKLRYTGGYVREANSAYGVFAVLNAQKQVPFTEIKKLESNLDSNLRVMTLFKEVDCVNLDNVHDSILKAGGAVGIAVIEDEQLPMLVTAPESGWALVNAKKIVEDANNAERAASRVRKEIMRAFAFITGGAYMTYADPLMRDVRKPRDLDLLQAEEFGPEILMHFKESSRFYGLKPWNEATYRDACEQGWAPAPTNEYQKAVWDKVHTIPTKPIKIEYNEKRDKGK